MFQNLCKLKKIDDNSVTIIFNNCNYNLKETSTEFFIGAILFLFINYYFIYKIVFFLI